MKKRLKRLEKRFDDLVCALEGAHHNAETSYVVVASRKENDIADETVVYGFSSEQEADEWITKRPVLKGWAYEMMPLSEPNDDRDMDESLCDCPAQNGATKHDPDCAGGRDPAEDAIKRDQEGYEKTDASGGVKGKKKEKKRSKKERKAKRSAASMPW
jgi:hypothetical protein